MGKTTHCDPAPDGYNEPMNETQIVAVLHECTTNDTNGNPRRCWTGINASGHIVRVEDEGYAGRPEWVRDLAAAGTYDVHVTVTPGHYRDRLKMDGPQPGLPPRVLPAEGLTRGCVS